MAQKAAQLEAVSLSRSTRDWVFQWQETSIRCSLRFDSTALLSSPPPLHLPLLSVVATLKLSICL